jgi:hypothetical protein
VRTNREMLTARRAEALFTSVVPTGTRLSQAETAEAIREAIRMHSGIRGVVGDVAEAFGDYPETAVPRMRWAIATVASLHNSHY